MIPGSVFPRVFICAVSIFYSVGTGFLVLALAGPELQYRQEVYLSAGADIIVVLDQSPSMGAIDSPPRNRFEVARDMIRLFMDNRSGDSIGLVGFGSEAILRSPPTTDYEWLQGQVDNLEVGQMGNGTAIGMGLALAVLHLSSSRVEKKVILLITDGDENYGEIKPETAARMAAGKDIQIYAVGIGSDGEVPVELKEVGGTEFTHGTIITRFDEDRLHQLAQQTGGEYWRARTPGAMEIVFQNIDSLESVERQVNVQIHSKPMHRSFIFPGLVLIFFAYMTSRLVFGLTP